MDPRRFDTLSRELTRARSRRSALAAVFGGTLGLLGLAETTAKHHKKHKKKGGGSLPVSSCAGQPDFTTCGGGGQCSGGVCATPPNCGVAPDGCASALECCGNVCDPLGGCPLSDPGNPCRDARSCSGGATCVGFVCQ